MTSHDEPSSNAVPLDYAAPTAIASRPFWPAVAVSLAACPAVSIAASVLGCQQALGSGWLSPANFGDSAAWGLFFGLIGGALVAAIAGLFRSKSLLVSVIGSLIVSAVSGVSFFLLVSMMAAC